MALDADAEICRAAAERSAPAVAGVVAQDADFLAAPLAVPYVLIASLRLSGPGQRRTTAAVERAEFRAKLF